MELAQNDHSEHFNNQLTHDYFSVCMEGLLKIRIDQVFTDIPLFPWLLRICYTLYERGPAIESVQNVPLNVDLK